MDLAIKSGKELKLSDVYGFPRLNEEKSKVTTFLRDMSTLVKYIETKKYISIRGQKEYGKTAF